MYYLLKSLLNDQDQAKLITILIITIPLSFLMYMLKNKYAILAISISFSILFQCIMFPDEKYILWVQQAIVYLLLKFGPRKNIGMITLFVTMIYLFGVQLRRMQISYAVNGVDITGILMMQTFLYVGLAYNYQNGLKKDQDLSQDARKRKVQKLPDVLTYLGYVFFLPASQVGPVLEFRDVQDYINRKGDYQKIPSTIKPILQQLCVFIVSLVVYFGTMSFDIWLTVKPQFAQQPYWYKTIFICLVIFHITFKYISAWSLGMVGIHASGLSYRKQQNDFQKIRVTKIIGFYFEPSLKVKIQCWNMSIQTALKRYIYDQIIAQKGKDIDDKSKKKLQAKAQQRTLFVSALWHGLYPGYFFSFFNWMIYLRMTQQLFRLRKRNKGFDNFWIKYKLDYLQLIASNFAVLYYGIFFHIMTWQNIKTILFAIYGIPLLVLYVLYFLIYQAQMFTKSKKASTKVQGRDSTTSASSQEQTPITNKNENVQVASGKQIKIV